MKVFYILIIAVGFNLSAWAQENNSLGRPPEEMTLVGKDSEKPIKLQNQNKKVKLSEKKKNKMSQKTKKTDQ